MYRLPAPGTRLVAGDVQRSLADRLPLDRNRRLVATERRKQQVGVRLLGDLERGSVQFGRQVPRVHGIRVGVDRRLRIDDVVFDETDAVGDSTRVDIRRSHGNPHIDEIGRQPGPTADSDLDDPIVLAKIIDQRLESTTGAGHGGTFMVSPPIAVAMLVDIVPVGNVSAEVKRAASSALRSVYDCEVSINDSQSVPNGAYDSGRNQYSAETFIQLAERVGRGDKNIAITPHDLFYRRRNYVFGLAYLDGSGSVVSTYRLQTSSDGGFSNKSATDIFENRVRKEIVHEIGHTYGLEHCDNNRCVMNFSPTVREVDIKEENLCGSCQRLIS